MKRIGTYLVIALIALVLGAFASHKWFTPDPIIETVTVTDTIIKTQIKESPIKYIDKWHESEPIIINVPNGTTIEPTDSISVATTKYVGKEVLDNGTIDYEIYADSLRATKFRLTTKDTVINTVTTITKTLPQKSRLFIGGGVDISPVNALPQEASLGLMYNRRNNWAVSATINKDLTGILPPDKSFSIGVKVWIPLFKKK